MDCWAHNMIWRLHMSRCNLLYLDMSTRNRYIFSSTPGKSIIVMRISYIYICMITYIYILCVHVIFRAWMITRYYLFYTYFIHLDSILFDCWFTYRAWHTLQYVSCIHAFVEVTATPAHLCLPCISGNVRLVRCLRVVGVPILVFEAESDISTDTGRRMAPVITSSDVKHRWCGQTRLTSHKLRSMPDEWFPSIQEFFCCKLL